MPFEPGTRLGPYEIVAPLGKGGMGEVYRARDTRLDRTVAVKVLTGALTADSESRLRFEQEARAIAALNDPRICTIHDVGRHDDADYLVLEYLEGETLAARLSRSPGTPLPVEMAMAIAIQVAEALDRAHRAGIAHRDLKPGNVMLLGKGSAAPAIKLLDFGLAARIASARSHSLDASAATMAVTLGAARTAPVSSASGFGTLQYMAPEQLDGDPGDHRADIFAFGCVLYEMLAGRKAFEAATAATAIAAIMSSEPPAVAALETAHPLLDHVLRRCLEKDRERRWQTIRDVAAELRWIAEQPVAATPTPQTGARRSARAAVAAALLVALAAVAAAVFAMRGRGALTELPTLRFEIATPPTDDPSMALSPDGTALVFVANRDHVPMLWVRSLDATENRALPGTEGASFPFWSPDGRAVGFFAGNKLKRIDVGGGTPLVVANASNARGGTWNSDGVILFAPGVNAPIFRVAARGGQAERVTDVNTGAGPGHRLPQFLPGGQRFLFSSALGTAETNGVYIGSLDKKPPVRVMAFDGSGRFAAPDKLLTIDQGALQAYDFDVASGTVHGDPVMLAQGLRGTGANGVFAVSDTGVLAYRADTAQRRQLAWVNRQGDVIRTIGEPGSDFMGAPELSPDEQSVVVFLQRTGDNDIWIIELARGLARRLTDGAPADSHPLWDPDGGHVVFNTQRFGGASPAREAVTGGKPEPLFTGGQSGLVLSWTHDRRYVLVRRSGGASGDDLVAVAMTNEARDVVVAQSPADESEGQFSPDGRWVAFVSNENGSPDVFVQSFPDGRGRTQISTAGATQVRWAADSKEIFYIAPDGKMTAVSVDLGGATPAVKLPVPLFQTHLASGINILGFKPQYVVARDGRFLLNTAIESASAPIVVSLNWMKKLLGR
jgi:Tol biopolymer transport system component/tRNA A-37 threonylcarbamoyl transferase component Bud32